MSVNQTAFGFRLHWGIVRRERTPPLYLLLRLGQQKEVADKSPSQYTSADEAGHTVVQFL